MKRRGMTLVELTTGLMIATLVILGSMTLFAGGMRSLQRTGNDATMTDQSSRTLRKISENVRSALSITISADGKTLTYTLPTLSAATDPATGEREVALPVTGDGVARSYVVNTTTGTVTETPGGRVVMRGVIGTDPDPSSTLYNQAYRPFSLSTIGTRKALTINIITRDRTSGQDRVSRMKTTTLLRNVP